jgi:NTE family protein
MRGEGGLAVVLSGGGARAAYQAGALASLARRRPELEPRIYTGVSAGAINATFLAAHPGNFAEATAALVDLWRGISADQIFRTDARSVAGSFARWGTRLVSGGFSDPRKARALVDAAPLRDFLRRHLEGPDGTISGIHRNLESGRLKAVAVSTLRYGTGDTVVWVQGRDVQPWHRPGRSIVRTRLAIAHVLASAALPIVFPAVRLSGGWHGDGGVRLTAPFSPAIHLGARRILAVSTRRLRPISDVEPRHWRRYPSPAQVGGQLLDAAFLDLFDDDARRLEKVNQICRALPDADRLGFRVIETLVLRPSADLKLMAAALEDRLPRALRYASRGLGVRETGGSGFLSLLLFIPEYISALLELGLRDASEILDSELAVLGD